MRGGWSLALLVLAGCTGSPTTPGAPASVGSASPGAAASVAPTPSIGPSAVPGPVAIATPVASFVVPAAPWTIAITRAGHAWLNCDGQVVEVTADGRVEARFRTQGFLARLFVVGGDQLWQTISASGAERLAPTGEVVKAYPAPSGDWVDVPVAVDEAGGVWVGYEFGAKICRYDADGTRTLDLPDGGPLLADPRGGVIVVRDLAAVRMAPSGAVIETRRLPDRMFELQAAADGTLWGFAAEGKELYAVRPDGTTYRHTVDRVYPRNLFVAGDDAWFTDRGALVRMSLATDEQVALDLGPDLAAVAYDPAGHVWASYQRRSPHPDGVSDRGLVRKYAMTPGFWEGRARDRWPQRGVPREPMPRPGTPL